jgi:methylenetetrahydrofolate dehydrogenase (NADP+)/methenyltetrahydrofolate cyclohydrolase/formyltetrahydrofolate synthetase
MEQKNGAEADFVLCFGDEPVQSRLTPSDVYVKEKPAEPIQPAPTWAKCKKSGRAKDGWDLEVSKGERVKVLRDMGQGWYVVEGRMGKGWCHGSWLDFSVARVQEDASEAYVRFRDDVARALVPGQLRAFPAMASYVDVCTRAECKGVKGEGVGICAHDLKVLLAGSGDYSVAWLKDARNQWHPDRFGWYCAAESVGPLKAKAEQMFVLYGLVMEMEME